MSLIPQPAGQCCPIHCLSFSFFPPHTRHCDDLAPFPPTPKHPCFLLTAPPLFVLGLSAHPRLQSGIPSEMESSQTSQCLQLNPGSRRKHAGLSVREALSASPVPFSTDPHQHPMTQLSHSISSSSTRLPCFSLRMPCLACGSDWMRV